MFCRKTPKTAYLVLVFLLGFLALAETSSAQNFWQQTNGPCGGTIRCMAVGENGLQFAGTDGGLYRSADGGATWKQVKSFPTVIGVFNVLNAASGAILLGTSYDGLWRSTDNGNTFEQVLREIQVASMVRGFQGEIYAAICPEGIHISTDEGGSWAPFALSGECISELFITSSGEFLAGIEGGIYGSDDGGQNWTFVELDNAVVRSFAENSSGDIFAASWDGGVFRSADGGQSWTEADAGFHYAKAIVTNPQDELFVGTDNGVFRSTDNGESWTQSGLQRLWILSLAEHNGNIFVGTLGQGLFKTSDNGASWQETHMGIMNTRIASLTVSANGDVFASPRGGRIYRSSDHGGSWSTVYDSGFATHLISTSDGEILAAVGRYLLRSGDSGRTWEELSYPFGREGVSAMTCTRQGRIYLGGTVGRLFRSSDGGLEWSYLVSHYDYDQEVNSYSHEIVDVDETGKGDIFFVTRHAGVYRSTDDGESWQQLNTPFTDSQLFGLVIDRLDQIYVGTNGKGVFMSVDNGETWLEGGLKYRTGSELVLDAYGNMFAGTSEGVFQSQNNGITWNKLHSGMGELSIQKLAVAPAGHLFAGTYRNGIFRSTQITGSQPESFSLLQNYPNPFNATTTIEFQLGSPGHVRLSVYNLMGQRVKILIDQDLMSGVYRFRWDARGMANGIYLCQIQTDNFLETTKLVLVK